MKDQIKIVKHWQYDSDEQCPGCNWRTTNKYGFECNGEKESLCGDCFCDILVGRKFVEVD